MPLEKSTKDKAVGRNISKLRGEGYPEKQAIAIAMETQREAKKKKGKR